jgi:hypothetical protein
MHTTRASVAISRLWGYKFALPFRKRTAQPPERKEEMANTSLLAKRFGELVSQLESVEATKKYHQNEFGAGDYVDNNLFLNWRVKARNLISKACGVESEHYKQFVQSEKGHQMMETNFSILNDLKAVFLAAKEDYEGGYLNSIRNLIQAEVFGTELDQATELLSAGYRSPAAVVAGVVLETTLRQLCTDAGITTGKLDKMNADLAKAGVYHLLVQKRITALADIRNNAAHGHPEKFKDTDVSDMISYVENFVAEHL